MLSSPKLAILLSGHGSTLQAIIDAIQIGELHADIAIVISDQADAYGLERAKQAGIPTNTLTCIAGERRTEYDRRLLALLGDYTLDLIVLAGFMRILSPSVIDAYPGCIINIHPSLLPKFPGLDTHARALEAAETEHGTSVHFVDASLDGGPLIAQARCPIEEGDTPDSLKSRVQQIERDFYPKVIAQVLEAKSKQS